jgi:hypothetical protein
MILETITTLEIINSDAFRRGIGSANSMGTNDDEVFSYDGLALEVFERARELPCFCTTVEQLNNHFRNVVKLNNAAKCEVEV